MKGCSKSKRKMIIPSDEFNGMKKRNRRIITDRHCSLYTKGLERFNIPESNSIEITSNVSKK